MESKKHRTDNGLDFVDGLTGFDTEINMDSEVEDLSSMDHDSNIGSNKTAVQKMVKDASFDGGFRLTL